MTEQAPTTGSAGTVISSIGEILWDVFPSGPRFGGAPANFACTTAGLAAESVNVQMVSAVGDDQRGAKAVEVLASHRVESAEVSRLPFPTGEVLITLDDGGSASYEFAANCAWDNLPWTESLQQLAQRTDVVCFGTLGQRDPVSRDTIQRFLRATSPSCLRVFDVNLRAPFYTEAVIRESLQLATVLKLNDEELPLLAKLYGLTGTDDQQMGQLAATCELDVIALTRGAAGATLFCGGTFSKCGGLEIEVNDTVGAGDAYTASLVLGLLRKMPADEINRHACEVAAFVCTQSGATPMIPEEFREFRA